MKTFFLTLLVLALLGAGGYWLVRQMAAESQAISINSSLVDNKLLPCPAAFICVNSDTIPTDSHFILPIADEDGSRWRKLVQTVDRMEGSELVLSTDNYAYFTFTTKYLNFVDDIEFHNRPIQQSSRCVHHPESANSIWASTAGASKQYALTWGYKGLLG